MGKSKGLWKAPAILTLTIMVMGGIFFLEPRTQTPPPKGDGAYSELFSISSIPQDSDLDVRDENNRPIFHPEAKEKLRSLFVASLYTLLAESEIPLMSQTLQWLEEEYDLLKHRLQALLDFFTQDLPSALPVSFRRLFEKLLWTCLAWMISLALLWRAPPGRFLTVPCRSNSPSILRC